MKALSDTSREAQRVLDDVYRAMPTSRKWDLLSDLYKLGRTLHAVGVQCRHPDATEGEIREEWIRSQLGQSLARGFERLERPEMEQPIESKGVVEHVVAVLEALGIEYALGGSLASSIHGVNRNTVDADITVVPFPGKEVALTNSLGTEYYVSLDAVRRAVRERSGFNIIQTLVGFKIDIFVAKDRPFERSVMQRRQPFTPSGPDARPIFVVSPEDVILLKLEWYRLGNEISDRQWTDVLGVLRIQGDRLDLDYLRHWATEIGVGDLLARAREEAGTSA
jgi:hypothetical protein